MYVIFTVNLHLIIFLDLEQNQSLTSNRKQKYCPHQPLHLLLKTLVPRTNKIAPSPYYSFTLKSLQTITKTHTLRNNTLILNTTTQNTISLKHLRYACIHTSCYSLWKYRTSVIILHFILLVVIALSPSRS